MAPCAWASTSARRGEDRRGGRGGGHPRRARGPARHQPARSQRLGAEPGRLVGRRRRHARRARRRASGADGGRARHRALRPDARRRAAGGGPPPVASRDALERRPRRPAGPRAACALPRLARVVGVPAMPGFTGPKIPWLLAHEPGLIERVRTVMLPKDYVRLQLTGEVATDMWTPPAPGGSIRPGANGHRRRPRRRGCPSPPCRRCWKLRNRPGRCAPRWPRAGACRRASSWRPARATPRPARSASARCATATRSCRSVPRRSSSSARRPTGPRRAGGARLLPRRAGVLVPDGGRC